MESLARRLAAALSIAAIVLFPAAHADAHSSYPSKRCLLGWIPYWDQESATSSFRENVTLFNTVSFFWYYLDKRGRVKPYERKLIDHEEIGFAQEHGVRVLAIVANLREGRGERWDAKRVDKVIGSKKARKAHVRELVALTEQIDVDGINIDYEALEADQKEDFTAFIRELGEALHARDKILAVALHPKTSEGDPNEANGSEAQDWSELHPYVDQMHLMTYGESASHRAGRSGPNASPAWMSSILDYAVNGAGIPRSKVYLGVPLYAESWSEVKPKRYRMDGLDLTYSDVRALEKRFRSERRWDEGSASPYLVYRDQTDRARVVWFENARSLRNKVALRDRFGVCNLGLWRLGGEDPAIWSELEIPETGSRLSGSRAVDEDDALP